VLGYVIKSSAPPHTEEHRDMSPCPGLLRAVPGEHQRHQPGETWVSPQGQFSRAPHRVGGPCPVGQGSLQDVEEKRAGIVQDLLWVV